MRKVVVVSALVLGSLLPEMAAVAMAQSFASIANRRQALKQYRAGQELLSGEQFVKAADAFRTAIVYEPLLADAHYGLAKAYMGLRRYPAAIQAFGQCIEAGKALYELRRRDQVAADRAFDEEIREMRRTTGRRSGQALSLIETEQRIQDVQRNRSPLATAFVVPASVLLSLGSAHFRNGEPDAAEQYWTNAVQVDGSMGEAWNNLAVTYRGSGRKAEALDAVRNAERAGFRVNPRLKSDIHAMP